MLYKPSTSSRSTSRRLAIGGAVAILMCTSAQSVLAQTASSTEEQASDLVSSPGSKSVPSSANVDVSDQAMRSATDDPKDWLLHGRDYSNQRYSPLSQINTHNIGSLVPAALIQTGMTASFETTPLVIDGVMYVTTPIVNNKMKIIAYNAATGARIWETTYDVGTQKLCCGPVNRGVSAGYGNLYVATSDANLLALNAKDGTKVWQTNIADPQAGYSETMTPQIYDGMVIVGSSGGEWPLRGFVAAYDAKTGKQVWRWDSTDPNTFEGDSWKTGGGMVWTTPAIDTKRGLIIFAVGNPNPDLDGESRKGDNLYTDSIVALDAKTGKLAWHYQEVKHDVWDYDAVSNVMLFDTKDDKGNTVPAAGEAGKVGWYFIVNRENGKLIRKSEPFVKMNSNMFKAPTKDGVDILPGANGGAEWTPPAYSPKTNDVYVPAMDQLMKFTSDGSTETVPGTMRLGSTFVNVKNNGVQDGTFSAVNVDTGKIDWQYKAPQPLIGGALATGGDLVFTGEGDGWFDAFNAKTGQKVWRYNLGAGVNAPPISYEVNGRQYIAVAAGGNFQLNYPRGDAIALFALPEETTAKHASNWNWRKIFDFASSQSNTKQVKRVTN
jgi:alcohol dehydrogenase (cytochrome c)